jgi:3-dehydroquinate synthase
VKTLTIEGKLGTSKIMTGASADSLGELVGDRRAVVITDSNVGKICADLIEGMPVFEIAPGEASKTVDSARSLYMRLMKLELDRSGFVVGVGGGVVTDLAGFVAATYLRGVGFGFVPTTLVAQVDAAIGGKNGVDLEAYKNLVGTFAQPEFVLCDATLLKTLPEDAMRDGLAEALKAGSIGDEKLFGLIESNASKLIKYNDALLTEIVEKAAAVKVKIVSADERESGARRLLNFGHTFGHALERTAGMSHGAAVAAGMIVAANLSVAQGTLTRADADRLVLTIRKLGLATSADVDAQAAVDAMRKDKKRYGDSIEFVLLNGIGSAITKTIPLEVLAEVADDLRKYL